MLKKQDGLSAAISTLVFKSLIFVFAFLKHIVIAGSIGLTIKLDIFYMSIAIIGVLVSSWGHVFDAIAIPKLVNYLNLKQTNEIENLVGGFLSIAFILSVLILSIFLIFPNIITYMAFGFSEEMKGELSASFIWLIPAILFFLPLNLAGSILKAKREFTIFYSYEILGSIIVLFSIYFYLNNSNVLYWSYSLSILLPFLFVFYYINTSQLFWFRNPFNSQTVNLIYSIPSLFLLHGSNYLFIFADRFFASFLGAGDMSALAYATTIIIIIPSVVGVPYYFLTLYSDEKSILNKLRKVNDMMSLVIFFSIPSIIFILFFGDNFISILFERGKFTSNDTLRVYSVMQALSIMIIPLLLQRAIDQIFQVEGKLYIVVNRTIFGLILNILFNYIALFYLDLGVIGIALSTSLANIIVLILSLISLYRLKIDIFWKRHLKWIFWLILCYSSIVFFDYFVVIENLPNVLELVVIIFLFLIVVPISLMFFKGHERGLLELVIKKILQR